MQVFKINKPIFDFPPDHPARRFLEAFVECRKTCVGRETEGIDQEWLSEVDGRRHRFSSFAYEWLSFDVELDGWLHDAPQVTESEKRALEAIETMRRLMAECKAAADGNPRIVNMCNQILDTLDLWSECIHRRAE